MVARSPRVTLPMAPTGAALAALVAAAAGLIAPDGPLARIVAWSGLPALLPAANPPLGDTARALLVAGLAAVAGALVWASLFLILGGKRLQLGRPAPVAEGWVPTLRRADAHPDAPARRPIFAEQDLGAPLAIAAPAPAEAPLPANLDLPLAAFDPGAVPDQPRPPVRAVPSLARPAPLAPGERIDTFPLTPEPPAEPASIESLIRRLEQGARRRDGSRPPLPPVPGGTLEQALSSLHRMARSA